MYRVLQRHYTEGKTKRREEIIGLEYKKEKVYKLVQQRICVF